MKFSSNSKPMAAIFALGALSGCGTYVPEIQEIWDGPVAGELLVKDIVRNVHCEVQNSVKYVIDQDKYLASLGENGGKRLAQWLDTWGAQITLNLTVDETSSINPGVTFNTPIITATTKFTGIKNFVTTSQQYNLALGGTLSSAAQRIDKLSSYYTVKELYTEPSICDPQPKNPLNGSLLLESDLKLREWLLDAALVKNTGAAAFPAYIQDPFKQNVISHEVKFVIVSSGNITPSWKLVRVSANQGSPFFGTGRTRTHDLLITFGPNEQIQTTPVAKKVKQPIASNQPALAPSNSHLASEIGLAVANSLQNLNLQQP